MKLKVLAASALAVATLIGVAGVAGATAPEPTGFDDVNDQVVGAGSDTTYPFITRSDRLYNESQGCETINTAGDANLGKCLTPANSATAVKGNWDHDFFVEKYPTGSGSGLKALQLGQVDYARSSRAPKTSGESDLNFWAFGKDGLVIATYGTRTPGNITKAQIQSIWSCGTTSWQTITGNPADAGKTIQPWGMNGASGTKATFDTYLGFDANAGLCVKKLTSGIYPFENDVKPILADAAVDVNNMIWWSSYAEFKSWSYKRQSGQSWSVDGVAPGNTSILNNSYTLTRFVYHVTKKVDVSDPGAGNENLTGADTGKAGAVREYTRFLCKGASSHDNNDFTGNTNYQELTNIYSDTGYQRLPTTERTNGICRLVPGP
jgi:ABC-type phosphate transport system substrate-binding protein